MPKEIDAQLNFVQLLRKATGEYPNWSPRGAKIRVGDYGTISPQTGAFRYDGSIYKLNDLAESAPPVAPDDYKDGDEFTVVSNNAKKHEFPTSLSAKLPVAASASLKGQWKFGDESGALLIVHRPRHRSLPYGTVINDVITHPKLDGKSLVIEVVTCPAYARYSHAQGGGEVSLALAGAVTIPSAPVTVGVDVAPHWVHDESGGVFDSGTEGVLAKNPDLYTVFYTLVECKVPDPEGSWNIFGESIPRRPRFSSFRSSSSSVKAKASSTNIREFGSTRTLPIATTKAGIPQEWEEQRPVATPVLNYQKPTAVSASVVVG